MSVRRIALAAFVALLISASAFAQTPKPQMLADFEDGKGGVFNTVTGTVAATKNLDGKSVTLKVNQRLAVAPAAIDTTAFNMIKVDVFNPTDQPARLNFCFKDDSAPHGYYSWINRYVSVKPGRSTLELYIPELKRGEGSPKDMLDPRPFHWDKLQWWGVTPLSGEVELDNIRLERLDVAAPAGVLAFDFGPADSPVFPGTVGVSPETAWSDAQGFGWSRKAAIWTRRRVTPPDNFVGDWIGASGAVFSVKVPNGKVHVWLLWEDPGEWELYQNFTSRRILANGKPALSETMTGEQFLDRYFHFAETEDLPGEDIYKKYLDWRYVPRTFDVDVTNGRLDLTIDGPNQYAATVNGIVVYPDAKKAEGEAFIKSLSERRREAFYKTWTEKLPGPREAAGAGGGPSFVLYRTPPGRDVQVYEALPRDAWLRPGDGFEIAAARGEYEPFSFTLFAQEDLKSIRVSVADLKTDDGKVLPAGAFDVRVVRYKFRRIGFSGAGVYGVQPWILVDGRETSVKQGMDRRFWITVHVPKDQPAGTYKGVVTVDVVRVPVSVRVLPIELPDADVGMSMFGVGNPAPYFPYFPENQARNEADRERSFAFAREHGFTSARVEGVRFLKFEGGKAQFDFSGAKKEADIAKRLGYPFIDLTIGGERGIWQQALDDKGDLAKKNGFASADDMVKELFGGCIREAKAAGLGEPVWSFGDEPPDTQAPEFIAIHKRIKALAGAKSYICGSPGGEATKTLLLDLTSIANLNVTTLADIKRAQAAGNTVELNNQGRNRWAFGLYMWKAHEAGVKNYLQFCWIGVHTDPYYPLDGYEDDGGHVYPDRAGNLRPVADLERIREGIDDYRYTLALTRAIAAKKSPVSDEAAAWLKSVLDKLKFEDTKRDRQPQMTEAELDAYRAKVQDYLLKLAP